MKDRHPLSPSDLSDDDDDDQETIFSRRTHKDNTDRADSDSCSADSATEQCHDFGHYDFTVPMLFHEKPASDAEEEEMISSSDKNQPKPPSPKRMKCLMIFGYIAAVLSAFFSAGSASCAQALGGYIPEFELNLFRFAVGFAISLPAVVGWRLQVIPDVRTCLWLALFCVIANVYNVSFYGAAIYLPVATLGGAESCLLILYTTVITLVVTRECKIPTAVCTILCTVGILLLLQPRFLFKSIIPETEFTTHPMCTDNHRFENKIVFGGVVEADFIFRGSNDTTTYESSSGSDAVISNDFKGYMLIIIASCAHASHVILLRHKLRNINVFIVLFWQGAVGMAVSVPIMIFFEQPLLPESIPCLFLVFGQSFGIGCATLMAIASMLYIPPVMYAVLSSLQLVFFLWAQYTVLKNINRGHHNAVEVAGAAIVFLGNIVGPVHRLYADMVDRPATTERLLRDDTDDEGEDDFLK